MRHQCTHPVLSKTIQIMILSTLLLMQPGIASESLLDHGSDDGDNRPQLLTKLALPQKSPNPYSSPSYERDLPNLKSCSDIINAYIGKVIGQYKLKKMVINETDIGTFVVPSDSFITYMMIMTPSKFDKIYLPKFRDKKFNCVKEGESFKGVYHLY